MLILKSCIIAKIENNEINPTSSNRTKAKNIILFIGDGMGISQLSTRFYYGDKQTIHFKRFERIGLINTSSAKEKITDSAAGATAFATGHRTYNGAISVDLNKNPLPTIVEQLSEKGMKTGIISTSSITHATPACFYAHTDYRKKEEDIAQQLVDSDIDFFAGGGLRFFTDREDGQNLIPALLDKGFDVKTSGHLGQKIQGGKKPAYLLADNGMPRMLDGRGDFLPDATAKAIQHLQNPNGFFLMVEGSQIDWGGHANDADYIITETADFDRAIGAALDFAQKDGNTLVIVTADHETGGFSLSAAKTDEGTDYTRINPTFSTGGHTACLIPVLAFGPGAEQFAGFYDNTDIYFKMKNALSE